MISFTMRLNIIDTICKGKVHLDSLYECIHRRINAIMRLRNSCPELEVSCGVEWMSLNRDFSHGVIFARSVSFALSQLQVLQCYRI